MKKHSVTSQNVKIALNTFCKQNRIVAHRAQRFLWPAKVFRKIFESETFSNLPTQCRG